MSSKLISNLKKGVFAVGRGLRYVGTALLFPVNITFPKNENGKRHLQVEFPSGKIALSTLVYFVAQPLATLLFPRAETVMQREGLDPAILSKITPEKNIRIIPDNLAGKAYYLFDQHPLLDPTKFYDNLTTIFNSSTAAFHDPSYPPLLAYLIAPDIKRIYMKDNRAKETAATKAYKATVEEFSEGSFTYKRGVTTQETFLFTLVHELRHTAPEQRKMSAFIKECDADYYAGVFCSVALKKPELAQNKMNGSIYFNWSGPHSSESNKIHDTTLYLYFRYNRLPGPDQKALLQANMEAAPVIAAMEDVWLGRKGAEEKLDKAMSKKLSELALLKIALYEQAVKALIVPAKPQKASPKPLKVS